MLIKQMSTLSTDGISNYNVFNTSYWFFQTNNTLGQFSMWTSFIMITWRELQSDLQTDDNKHQHVVIKDLKTTYIHQFLKK